MAAIIKTDRAALSRGRFASCRVKMLRQSEDSVRHETSIITIAGLDALFAVLHAEGYRLIGPRTEAGVIALGPIESAANLPTGLRDVHAPGSYRTEADATAGPFAHASPANAWKQFLYPPVERLWRAERDGVGFRVADDGPDPDAAPLALIGVRACDLAAIAVLDAVLTGDGRTADARYRARRERTLIIAVDCARAAETCFCAAMGTGPRAAGGFDLVVSTLPAAAGNETAPMLIAAGSETGAALLAKIEHRPASPAEQAAGEAESRRAVASMTRTMPEDIAEILEHNLEHPIWDEIAERCLGCANCTLVCPTCFCASVEDTTDLAGETAERRRLWDSCFTIEHSYIHGGSIRPSAAARYRQWMAHKLSFWHGQFGTSGCVGCGRCITWCPVGIDITEEAARFAAVARGRR